VSSEWLVGSPNSKFPDPLATNHLPLAHTHPLTTHHSPPTFLPIPYICRPQTTNMTREQLLKELQQHTYITIKPSAVHGIGVFAIRDIPKGCREIFSRNVGEWIKLSFAEVDALPEHSRNLIETYCLYDEENYYVPDYGFKVMDLVNYLNHSSTPNIVSVNEGEEFEALRDIKVGEELFVDYHYLAGGLEDYQ